MPQICHFCGKEITKKYYDKSSESLVFHSLDGNHDNWDPSNKVPAHHGCHVGWHNKHTTDFVHHCGYAMANQKEFINLGSSKGIIIPMVWIKSEESIHHKKMRGVYMELVRVKDEISEDIRIAPMWDSTSDTEVEEEKIPNGGELNGQNE